MVSPWQSVSNCEATSVRRWSTLRWPDWRAFIEPEKSLVPVPSRTISTKYKVFVCDSPPAQQHTCTFSHNIIEPNYPGVSRSLCSQQGTCTRVLLNSHATRISRRAVACWTTRHRRGILARISLLSLSGYLCYIFFCTFRIEFLVSLNTQRTSNSWCCSSKPTAGARRVRHCV